jgi:outer membrane protein assembly factor BamB
MWRFIAPNTAAIADLVLLGGTVARSLQQQRWFAGLAGARPGSADRAAWTKPVLNARWNPVFAKGTIYIVNGNQIQALRSSDGGLLWSWIIPAEKLVPIGYGMIDAKNMLITDNVLFAGFKNHVYAIDFGSRQTAWTFARGGEVSLSSNGVLYVSSTGMHFAFTAK